MTERFKKAYDSLVRAFFEGTLAKGSCTACACGNIIFDAIGDPMTKEMLGKEILSGGFHTPATESGLRIEKAMNLWTTKRVFIAGGRGDHFKAKDYYKDEINAAGYTAQEFADIETAFEGNTRIQLDDYPNNTEQAILEDQYNGLCAVVDVLMKLDGMSQGVGEYKQKFREHPKLQTA